MNIPAQSAQKPGRGRPRSSTRQAAELALPDYRPRRGMELIYQQEALELLAADPGCAWLTDPKRKTLRVELGRSLAVGMPEGRVLELARELCQEQPSSTVGRQKLRSARLAWLDRCRRRQLHPPRGLTFEQVLERLLGLVERLAAAYPGTSPEDLHDAAFRLPYVLRERAR